jgi:uncharacterized protein YecT (DUF1311 family)
MAGRPYPTTIEVAGVRAFTLLFGLPVLLASTMTIAAAPSDDLAEVELRRCLAAPEGSSTSGQTTCESAAARRYDRRMNAAYVALMRKLPADAAARLRTSQRAWLAFHVAEQAALSAMYETRTGTMYVPMQAAASTSLLRDRALQLEASLRVSSIDE